MGGFWFSGRRLFPYSAQCWLRQWIRVSRQFCGDLDNFYVKVDSRSSGASPEEYKKSGLLLEMTLGTMPVFRWLPGSTVDSRPRASLSEFASEMSLCILRCAGFDLGSFLRQPTEHLMKLAFST